MKITKRNEKNDNSRFPTVRDPLSGIFSLREAMDRLFDESFWSPFGLLESDRSRGISSFAPRVDISETDTDIKVRADIPGMNPEDINIEVTEDTLALSGSHEKSEEEKGENFYRIERQSGQFSREFVLPSKIDTDSVEAKAKHGVLTITLKKQPSEQKRKVQIKSE